MRDGRVMLLIAAASALAFIFLIWLIYWHEPERTPDGVAAWSSRLPAFNALCNALSALCLTAGYRAVRRRELRVHKRLMLSALGFSALFLAGYVLYHSTHGDTKFLGVGAIRPVYFTILISHIALTVVCLPAILAAVFFAAVSSFDRHRRVARYAFPMWMYVSVTGVAIFVLLRAYG